MDMHGIAVETKRMAAGLGIALFEGGVADETIVEGRTWEGHGRGRVEV